MIRKLGRFSAFLLILGAAFVALDASAQAVDLSTGMQGLVQILDSKWIKIFAILGVAAGGFLGAMTGDMRLPMLIGFLAVPIIVGPTLLGLAQDDFAGAGQAVSIATTGVVVAPRSGKPATTSSKSATTAPPEAPAATAPAPDNSWSPLTIALFFVVAGLLFSFFMMRRSAEPERPPVPPQYDARPIRPEVPPFDDDPRQSNGAVGVPADVTAEEEPPATAIPESVRNKRKVVL